MDRVAAFFRVINDAGTITKMFIVANQNLAPFQHAYWPVNNNADLRKDCLLKISDWVYLLDVQ